MISCMKWLMQLCSLRQNKLNLRNYQKDNIGAIDIFAEKFAAVPGVLIIGVKAVIAAIELLLLLLQ